MRCVTLLLFCVLCGGCGAMLYQNGETKISIVKFGVDTTLESGKYMAKTLETETTIDINGYADQARIELLREAIDLAKNR